LKKSELATTFAEQLLFGGTELPRDMPAQSAHPSSAGTETKRSTLLKQLFPKGVPTLWCPLLTHYHSAGGIDSGRIAAHLQHLAPNVKGFLIPGSTGDAWELEEPEYWQLLEFALREAE